jgi:hypothetical protein
MPPVTDQEPYFFDTAPSVTFKFVHYFRQLAQSFEDVVH